MIIKLISEGSKDGGKVSLRCPACKQLGTFDTIPNVKDVQSGNSPVYTLGSRRCPNSNCRAHIFIVFNTTEGKLIVSYPQQRIDFDSVSIPFQVTNSLEESLTCHANSCFKASAIMIRKTLEELCKDRNATGKTLKDRITSLSTKVVLPQELLDALDHLRLLGNDAAHVESLEYDQVGPEEVEAAIAVTKEILKAVYQYSSIVDQLKSLKKKS